MADGPQDRIRSPELGSRANWPVPGRREESVSTRRRGGLSALREGFCGGGVSADWKSAWAFDTDGIREKKMQTVLVGFLINCICSGKEFCWTLEG
jgi:hypothetical protein